MVGRHQSFGGPDVEPPARFRAATDEPFTECNVVVCSIVPMPVHFPPNGPLGSGLGKYRELFSPCRVSEPCPALF